ncbi:hypothetical protein ACET3Z_005404 [Daucus carota]
MRDIVSFSDDIDNCANYNWCGLLIEKLKRKHAFWNEERSRDFTGSLPFLIYLYVNQVNNGKTSTVSLQTPAYKVRSNMLLLERQKFECKNDSFGVGHIGGKETTTVNEMNQRVAQQDKELQEPQQVGDKEDDIVADSVSGSLVQQDDINTVIDDVCRTNNVQETVDEGDRFTKSATEYMGEILVESGTQARFGAEIEKHFEEKAYKKCIAYCVSTFALFPESESLAKLKAEYPMFFNLFAETSPMTKNMCLRSIGVGRNVEVMDDDDSFVPNYSLGISQISPKNLEKNIEGLSCIKEKANASAVEKATLFPNNSIGQSDISSKDLKTSANAGCSDKEYIEKNREHSRRMGKVVFDKDGYVRQMRGLAPSRICRSPFGTRVTDVNAHRITIEERDLWD